MPELGGTTTQEGLSAAGFRDVSLNVHSRPESRVLREAGVDEQLSVAPSRVRCKLRGTSWVLKEMQDRSLAAIFLLLVAPAFLLIACGIKLTSRGPVFYRQKRRGYRGEPFSILKFRTMEVHPSPSLDSDLRLTVKNDPRVFPFGAFLRRSSLDELPQLLNVLRGDMWVIGPRPHALFAKAAGIEYRRAVSDYDARYIVKPGITGWAQVNGWRGPTETVEQLAKRVQHDLYYIENWSLFLDMIILLRTLYCIVPHKNAY